MTPAEQRLTTDSNVFIDRAIEMLKDKSNEVAWYNGIVSLLQYAKESHALSPQGQMKWVRASERLPETFYASDELGTGSHTLFIKLNTIPYVGRWIVEAGATKECWVIAGFGFINKSELHLIEWLDESTALDSLPGEGGDGFSHKPAADSDLEDMYKATPK